MMQLRIGHVLNLTGGAIVVEPLQPDMPACVLQNPELFKDAELSTGDPILCLFDNPSSFRCWAVDYDAIYIAREVSNEVLVHIYVKTK